MDGTKPTPAQIKAMVHQTRHIITHKICTGCGIDKDLETGYHEPVIRPYMVVLDEIKASMMPRSV